MMIITNEQGYTALSGGLSDKMSYITLGAAWSES